MRPSRGKFRFALITGVVALFACAVAAFLFERGLIVPGEPDVRRFPVRGIDVSHHQGVIAWGRLRAQRVRFVYLKASEGGDWTDPMYARNISAAPAKTIALGAYHFFTLCTAGRIQAANFIRVIVPAAKLSLPPAVDVEYVGNCAARPSRSVFAHELLAFIATIKTRLGVTPVIYSTQTFFDDYLSGAEFATSPLWVRSLFGEASWSRGRPVLFRQFADHAHFDGIKGPVDVDVFAGSEAQFAVLVSRGGSRR